MLEKLQEYLNLRCFNRHYIKTSNQQPTRRANYIVAEWTIIDAATLRHKTSMDTTATTPNVLYYYYYYCYCYCYCYCYYYHHHYCYCYCYCYCYYYCTTRASARIGSVAASRRHRQICCERPNSTHTSAVPTCHTMRAQGKRN